VCSPLSVSNEKRRTCWCGVDGSCGCGLPQGESAPPDGLGMESLSELRIHARTSQASSCCPTRGRSRCGPQAACARESQLWLLQTDSGNTRREAGAVTGVLSRNVRGAFPCAGLALACPGRRFTPVTEKPCPATGIFVAFSCQCLSNQRSMAADGSRPGAGLTGISSRAAADLPRGRFPICFTFSLIASWPAASYRNSRRGRSE